MDASERNVGGVDRRLRAVGAVVALAVAAWALPTGRARVGVAAGLVGAGLLFNALTGFCGLNALLGIDTCRRSGRGD
jgi:hypothetical protein